MESGSQPKATIKDAKGWVTWLDFNVFSRSYLFACGIGLAMKIELKQCRMLSRIALPWPYVP